MQLTTLELSGWVAYFEHKRDQQKKQLKDSNGRRR
jgi:hypothetical protein